MANPEHVEIVRRGREAIAEWRRLNRYKLLGLSGADLLEADLSGADLSGADLSWANLSGADLLGADLSGADLSGANLSWANLSVAHLSWANLSWAHLSGARLSGADLSEAHLAFTTFADVDLSEVKGLADVNYQASSSIGVDTLIASLRGAGNQLTPELRTFFIGAGVPGELLDALPRIVAEVKYYPCFISYGQPDLEFAQKLYADLQSKGVSCWLYWMDRIVGERTWREIREKRREAEKIVVLCSTAALIRDGVLKEIEEQIDEDPDKLVPVSLDNIWKDPGFLVSRGQQGRELKPFLLDKNYADFSDLAKYQQALADLLRGLRRRD